MDSVLLPLLRSTDEAEREQLLSDLILFEASPLVRNTLRQRLGFYVSPLGANPRNHDAEDLYHDVMAKLIGLLNDPQLRAGRLEVKNFRRYVLRVATNACHDYLRARSPARNRLKNNLRDLLERHPDFALWRVREGEPLCGFTVWLNRDKSPFMDKRFSPLEGKPQEFLSARFAREDVKRVPLTRLVAEVFRWLEGPVEFERLVQVAALLLDVKDQPPRSLDEEGDLPGSLTDPSFRCETRLEVRELLRSLWAAVRRLPPKQRDTFGLSFADDGGDDLFTLLLDAEIATLPEIAAAFERSLEDLIVLWQLMPMDNAGLAQELRATRQQVNKWRFRALRQLEKEFQFNPTSK
jgi:RNA polymerase sigma factor (sigma-70 family)